jgi:hypothetical protein
MQRYTREELLRASGALADELADFEAKRMLLPNRPRSPFGQGEPYYTASQLAVLRYLLRSRRAWEATRRANSPGQATAEAAPSGATQHRAQSEP